MADAEDRELVYIEGMEDGPFGLVPRREPREASSLSDPGDARQQAADTPREAQLRKAWRENVNALTKMYGEENYRLSVRVQELERRDTEREQVILVHYAVRQKAELRVQEAERALRETRDALAAYSYHYPCPGHLIGADGDPAVSGCNQHLYGAGDCPTCAAVSLAV